MVSRNLAFLIGIASSFVLNAGSARSDDMSDMANWCASKATAPSSVVICSDPELRRMAIIRTKIFADARSNLTDEDMNQLQADQNHWIHEYTATCGAPVNGPPVNLPVSQEIVSCYKVAGRERLAELLRRLRNIIPTYQIPTISGDTIVSSAGTGNSFTVTGIANNDVLNIRQQATAESPIVGVIPPNSSGVTYAGDRTDDGRWLLIRYGSVTGWVATRYLRQGEPSSLAPSPSPSSVAPPSAPVQPSSSAPTPLPLTKPDESRNAQAAADERERLRQQAAQEQLKRQLGEKGFKLLDPTDLDLDWKTFASNQAKVAVIGTYVAANDMEEISTPDNKDLPTIRLYTDDASRSARKIMLECRNSDFKFAACQMAIGATVQKCVRNKDELNEKEIPCLRVQEAYLVP